MLSKKGLVAATFGTIAAALLIITQTAGTADNSQAYKLEGTWTATCANPFDSAHPFRWTYTVSPVDASGKEAVVRGEWIVPIPSWLFVPEIAPGGQYAGDYFTSFYGEARMTGPDSAVMTAYSYGMKNDPALGPQIVYITAWVSELKFCAQNKLEATHYMAFYPPNATGIVTHNDQPFAVFPFNGGTSVDMRLAPLRPGDFTLKK